MTATVTVIIPNYNGMKFLEPCFEALKAQTYRNFKILVVDNGSDDGSTEVISSLDLTMLALKENTGFCGAVNEGIRRADTPYVILLNNDTEVLPEFVEELLAAIKKSDRIFSAGAMMIDYHDRGRIDNAGDYYTAFGWAVARGKGKPLADFNRPCRVFSCCGGAVIYRTGLLREMGPFDEPFCISRGCRYGVSGKNPRIHQLLCARSAGVSCGERYHGDAL